MRRLLAGSLALLLLLSGCARRPERADDGARWEEDWEMLGSVMGVEAPGHELRLLDNASVLAGEDTYYATWVVGEGAPYTNADGEATELYPAQLYLLLYGCADAAQAEQTVGDWLARERGQYAVLETQEQTHNAQPYTVLVYDVVSETNPYARGASAFGVLGRYAIAAEFTCTADYEGDAAEVLSDVLDGCHYSAAADK
ncbi:MAG: hypothetical protein K6G54_00360 [Oscillospiraceae bacterium]|nr:hypothetical protein [Oscillospiraceae bacterium]